MSQSAPTYVDCADYASPHDAYKVAEFKARQAVQSGFRVAITGQLQSGEWQLVKMFYSKN